MAIGISSAVTYMLVFIGSSYTDWSMFSLLICLSSLHVLDTNPLIIYLINYFSQVMAYLSFGVQVQVSLCQIYSIDSSTVCADLPYLWNTPYPKVKDFPVSF